jgi:hypothetical protein
MHVKKPAPPTTRALVDQMADGDPADFLSLGELLDRFSERSFGLFLLLVMLPCFIPIPVGQGGVSGALAALIGAQFLFRLEHPWLPRFLAKRQFQRSSLIRFRDRMGKWLGRIERMTRARNEGIFLHPVAHAFTGLLLVLLGVALVLPIPLTNYPFGLILLAFAFALIERDGRLMLIAWIAGVFEIIAVAFFSGSIATLCAEAIRWVTSHF